MKWLGERAIARLRELARPDPPPSDSAPNASADQGPAAAGELIDGRFEVVRHLGAGGMGTVYLALDRESGQEVALKICRDRDLVDELRFARETRVLAELNHPGVVRYIAHGTTSRRGAPYLAMEYLVGRTLAERLREGPLTPAQSVALLRRLADGLSPAHRRGLVHRDIKPANVLCIEGALDRVKVCDFGLARRFRLGDTLTRRGDVVGTPAYMSPEQARGDLDVDPRADVFALGCVLFECCVGRPPFLAASAVGVLMKVLLEEAPALDHALAEEAQRRGGDPPPSSPPALAELLARMLAKDRDDRPRDAAQLAMELARLEESLGASSADSPAAGAPQLTTGERRVSSLLLTRLPAEPRAAALPGRRPTTSSESNGPDPAALGEAIREHGGVLQALADGSLLVAFTGAGAATDLAARAAASALALRERLGAVPIVVVSGRSSAGHGTPVGELIDRGTTMLAELASESGGPSGDIALDDATAALLDQAFDVQASGVRRLLFGARPTAAATRQLLGQATQFVGRDRELGLLVSIWDECVDSSVARAAVVTGAAGIGKSRLRYELVRRLAKLGGRQQLWLARGDPRAAGSSFALIGMALRDAAGIGAGQPLREQRRALQRRVGRHLDAGEASTVSEFLGEALGLGPSDADSVELRAARNDPMLMAERIAAAWERLLAAECAAQPLLLVFEDLHWGDLPSAKLVDGALRALADRRFMVLALGRPELADVFPGLWSTRPRTEIQLPPLSTRYCGALVRAALRDVDEATLRMLVARSDGNPFYLEELIRAAAAGDVSRIPETVAAMVQARMEGMETEARRVLRAASVFGQTFTSTGVAALLGGSDRHREVEDWLRHLAEQEVLVPLRRGQVEYAFRHALLHDAAYGMLTDADRALGHRLAGQWMEGLSREGGGQAAVLPLTLAEHFDRGEVPERAARWYLRAAEVALDAGDVSAVVSLGGRALASATAAGAEEGVVGRVRVVMADAHLWLGEPDAAAEKCSEVLPRVALGSAIWFDAAARATLAAARLGQRERVGELGRAVLAAPAAEDAAEPRLRAMPQCAYAAIMVGCREEAGALLSSAEALGAEIAADHPDISAHLLTVQGVQALRAGDLQTALERLDQAVTTFDGYGDRKWARNLRSDVGYLCLSVGDTEKAERYIRHSMAESAAMGMTGTEAASRQNLALALVRAGKLDEAIVEASRAARDIGADDRRLEASARCYLSEALRLSGDLVGAERAAREAVEAARDAGHHAEPGALATLALALLPQGRASEALEVASQAVSRMDRTGEIDNAEALVRLAHAEALHATGSTSAARAAIGAARDALLKQAGSFRDPTLREGFLRRVPEHARTLELADAWG